MRRIPVLIVLFALTGCPADDDAAGVDGGSCMCTARTAQQVTYDNASSMLGADNVQDAIDELESRAAEPPLAGRIIERSDMVANTGVASFNATLDCPMAGDLAIGGGCGSIPGAQLVGAAPSLMGGAGTGSFTCQYQQPGGTTDMPFVNVICFRPAAQP